MTRDQFYITNFAKLWAPVPKFHGIQFIKDWSLVTSAKKDTVTVSVTELSVYMQISQYVMTYEEIF